MIKARYKFISITVIIILIIVATMWYKNSGFKSLAALREKYLDDSKQAYEFDYAKAEYGDSGMTVEIPVYARILNTAEDVDSPNRIVYYLVYVSDGNSKITDDNAINDNWFVVSEALTVG